jgi:hypothetical protein
MVTLIGGMMSRCSNRTTYGNMYRGDDEQV